MDSQQIDLDSILQTKSLTSRLPSEAIELIGKITDQASDAGRADVLRHAVALADTINRDVAAEPDKTALDYYLANLWNGIKRISGPHPGGRWEWDNPEIEKETVCIRRALRSKGFQQSGAFRQCQILTNLANCYSTTGRFIEALNAWEEALASEPRFGMARGNRAVGLLSYARALYDGSHAYVFARDAWRELEPSRLLALEPGAGEFFADNRRQIEARLPVEFLNEAIDFEDYSLGDSEPEIAYRRWCLKRKLFLNPLNDLGPYAIADRDILTAPSIVAPIGEGPRYHGFFNQIKQEFCSARWLAFSALESKTPHFSDAGVLLYNTLDYPSYSLATETLKLAFRSAYSVMDKIAFFLNAYLGLAIPEKQISFRGIWYEGQQKKKGIRAEFKSRPNLPLRGLFWLGKDLYEDSPDFTSVIDPDAQRLSIIRNHLEHKYLKLHQNEWTACTKDSQFGFLIDDLAESLYLEDFKSMTMRLISLARSALMYLSLGIHQEERARAESQPRGSITPPMPLTVWEDEWKR